MTLWTSSKGIFQRRAVIEACLQEKLALLKPFSKPGSTDTVVGWGLKKNTQKAKRFASINNLDYLYLEDGFIGYVGHPATNGHSVSLIADANGLYYDARTVSKLEQLITVEKSDAQLDRSQLLMSSLCANGITKYNCYSSPELTESLRDKFAKDEHNKVLVIDQVAGDLSIEGALASEQSFIDMLDSARANHPNATIYVRVHPDTKFGKKVGVLASQKLDNVEIIDDICHPHALLKAVDYVYTVSSQMGFEALLLDKPVYCFGMPFYAGWGLTQDALKSSRRKGVSLQALVHASLIDYPKYVNPITKQVCEVEDIVELIVAQYVQPKWQTLYAVNFSTWKKAFIESFCKKYAINVRHVNNVPDSLNKHEQVLLWGMKNAQLTGALRVEDGFIRSAGLGSDLCRPSSLAFDDMGMYFDSSKPSRLEQLISSANLSSTQLARAKALLNTLRQNQVSKYNVGQVSDYQCQNVKSPILLVVGQVDGDASLAQGSPFIGSNEELLRAVRDANPTAHIIYKPHPDVVAGNRDGKISSHCKQYCVDEEITELSLSSLYAHIDQLHTMTSLSGFEALVQGVKVVTWGQPFYAGWGLTKDMHPLTRRTKCKTLEELAFAALIQYPIYIDWTTGLFTSAENIVQQIQQQQLNQKISLSPMQRIFTKLGYLWQALTMRLSF
ncbi:capsular polysaccharide biosynthesis protein [Thalassotalea ponticola]|uniref:capsular polysaccharide biosynthesis protein n=1 Tax=Thalassotalea ponticola TaxID=1523392 RepID=UPI0025B494EC|nr:capsular polysaccharide biosynthesis protein [Thalassotalea ponticola]MDN3651806.1 capsular polysaccharide biosynthesis protein [Thalassotalea ponticola]